MKKPLPPIPQATPHAATVATPAREATQGAAGNVAAVAKSATPPALTVQQTRQQRLFDTLQLPDNRTPPHESLLLNADAVIAPHMPQLEGDKAGMSVAEVFCAELGIASTRARAFLAQWLTLRRYKPAFELAGCRGAEVSLWRTVSPSYSYAFDGIDVWIRAHRHHEAEDTLHALGNGEIRKVKETTNPDGSVVTVDEGAIYDTKALALELQAQDRARYGTVNASGSGVSITVNVSAPRPEHVVTVAPVATAEEAQDVDFDMVEA